MHTHEKRPCQIIQWKTETLNSMWFHVNRKKRISVYLFWLDRYWRRFHNRRGSCFRDCYHVSIGSFPALFNTHSNCVAWESWDLEGLRDTRRSHTEQAGRVAGAGCGRGGLVPALVRLSLCDCESSRARRVGCSQQIPPRCQTSPWPVWAALMR